MKKRLALAMMVVAMMFVLAACGKDLSGSPHVGKWVATTAEYSGVEMSVESLLGGDMVIELKDNGKCTLTIAGDSVSGKWDESEDGFVIDGGDITAVSDGKVATIDYSGVTLTFEKQ